MTERDAVASWTQVLDDFEASLDWHEEHLAAVDVGDGLNAANVWQPPVGVAEIPDHLRSRAQALVERSATIGSLISVKMASVAPSGHGTQRRRTQQSSRSVSTFSTKL